MTDRPPKKPNKSAFVRSLPASTSAKEAVANAKAAGMKISEAYVYTIRSSTRARVHKGPPGKPGRPKGSKNVASGATSKSTTAHGGAKGVETSFRKLVLDLGIRRSRELLDDVEQKLARLIAGA